MISIFAIFISLVCIVGLGLYLNRSDSTMSKNGHAAKDVMKTFSPPTVFAFLSVMLLALVNLGCSMKADVQPPMPVASASPKETLFTVVETEDPEYPTLAASIRLPFRVNSGNTVVLAEKHAYLTTERHLHVIDLSIPQRPVYLASLAFADDLGKVLSAGDHLVVTTRNTLQLVDVSQPSRPRVESTVHLPDQNTLTDVDVRESHLYVMSANDHLYVFSINFGHARLVKAVALEKRWWLLSPKTGGLEIEQIPLSTSSDLSPEGIWDPLLFQRGFLQLLSSRSERVRASSEFLVIEALRDPTWDILIYDAGRISDVKIRVGGTLNYNVDRDSREHLATTGEKPLTRRKPTVAYRIGELGEMQQIPEEPSSETIDIDAKGFMGPVADFQISDDQLCVVSEKGFLAIHHVLGIEDIRRQNGERSKLLSVTPLQPSRPISIAMGQHYACVLAVSGAPQK